MKTKLRAERQKRGWTLDYVAEQVGVSAVQVSRIESTGVKASETATALAKLFGNVSLEEICGATAEADHPHEAAAS